MTLESPVEMEPSAPPAESPIDSGAAVTTQEMQSDRAEYEARRQAVHALRPPRRSLRRWLLILLIATLALAALALVVIRVASILRLPRIQTQIALFYHPPNDGTPAQALSGQLGVAILTHGDEVYREQLRQAGFQGPVVEYVIANQAEGPSGVRSSSASCGQYTQIPSTATGISGDFCSTVDKNEGNFLHNGKGERLFTTDSWQEGGRRVSVSTYAMNPASPDWRGYLTRSVNSESAGYSGMFLDNIDVSLDRLTKEQVNSDGQVREYGSAAAYDAAIVQELAQLRQQVGPQLLLWANITESPDTADAWTPYLAYLDGVMDESFVDKWDNGYDGEDEFDAQLARAADALRQGKGFVGVAQGSQNETARMHFALGAYLLVAQPGAAFRYADSNQYSSTWTYPDYTLQLGRAEGPRYQTADGLWQRDFTCGTVRVDPSQHRSDIIRKADGLTCRLFD